MEAHIFLADAAQVDSSNKLHVLGMGWTTVGSPLPAHALAILINVPWNKTNVKHTLRVQLLDADAESITVKNPQGQEQPLVVDGQFESGRPPGLPPGSAIDVRLAFPIGPGLTLKPGRYEWRLLINDDSDEHWSASFLVR